MGAHTPLFEYPKILIYELEIKNAGFFAEVQAENKARMDY
jgi:hypothetical protein